MDKIRNLKISNHGFDREKSKVKVKALTLTNIQSSEKSENQKVSEDYEIIYLKTREKMKFIDIEFMILG